jgi:ABC-type spermidine/putrescine transport system permease subunit II
VSSRSAWRGTLLIVLAAATLIPLALLAVASVGERWFFPALLPPAITLESWHSILAGGRLTGALATSAALAAGTGLLAAAVFLPVVAPPIALATGLQLSFLSLGLGGTLAGVLLAHTIPAAGYTSLYFLGLFQLLDPRLEDEARSLGAAPRDVWLRVLLPVLRRPIAEAWALGFLVSWAQVPLTLLIGGGAVRTLPLETLAFVRAGQDRWAATGALLLVLPAAAALAAGLVVRRAEAAPL